MKENLSLCVQREREGQYVQPVRVRVRVRETKKLKKSPFRGLKVSYEFSYCEIFLDFEFKDNLPIFCYFSTKLWKRALTVVNRKMFLSGHAKSISLAGEGGRDLKNCHFAMTNEPFFILLGGGKGGGSMKFPLFRSQ